MVWQGACAAPFRRRRTIRTPGAGTRAQADPAWPPAFSSRAPITRTAVVRIAPQRRFCTGLDPARAQVHAMRPFARVRECSDAVCPRRQNDRLKRSYYPLGYIAGSPKGNPRRVSKKACQDG